MFAERVIDIRLLGKRDAIISRTCKPQLRGTFGQKCVFGLYGTKKGRTTKARFDDRLSITPSHQSGKKNRGLGNASHVSRVNENRNQPLLAEKSIADTECLFKALKHNQSKMSLSNCCRYTASDKMCLFVSPTFSFYLPFSVSDASSDDAN